MSALGPPLTLYSRPPFRSDLATRPPTQRGIRVFGAHPPDSSSGFGLVPSHAERFPIPFLHFMNNNTQGRILYYNHLAYNMPECWKKIK